MRTTLAVWVVFWGMYRHSQLIQRVHRETYQGYVQLRARHARRAAALESPARGRAPGGPAPGCHRTHRAPGWPVARVVSGAGEFPPHRGRSRCARPGSTALRRAMARTGITGNHPQIRALGRWRRRGLNSTGQARIVIVGCGFGGLFAAKALRHTPADVLVDRPQQLPPVPAAALPGGLRRTGPG